MAIPPDQLTDKSLNLCDRLMKTSAKLMEAVEEFAALLAEKESSGLDFTEATFEAKLATSGLKHANGDAFNGVLTSGAAVKTFLETNFHDDNFQKVRP